MPFIYETGDNARLTRGDVAGILSKLLIKMNTRTDGDRFRVRDSDSAYLQYVRVMVQAAVALNQLIKDEELENYEDRLLAIEEQIGRRVSCTR